MIFHDLPSAVGLMHIGFPLDSHWIPIGFPWPRRMLVQQFARRLHLRLWCTTVGSPTGTTSGIQGWLEIIPNRTETMPQKLAMFQNVSKFVIF